MSCFGKLGGISTMAGGKARLTFLVDAESAAEAYHTATYYMDVPMLIELRKDTGENAV